MRKSRILFIGLLALAVFASAMPVYAQTKVDLVALKGSIVSTAVTVGNTATKIPTTPLAGRRTLVIYHNGTNDVFLGPSGVTIANGLVLDATNTISLDVSDGIDVYGIVAAGTEAVRCMEIR